MAPEPVPLRLFLHCLVPLICAEAAAGYLLHGREGAEALLLLGLFRVAETGIFLLLAYLGTGGLRAVGLAREQLWPGLKFGVKWSLGFGALALAGLGLAWLAGADPLGLFRSRPPGGGGALAAYVAVGVVIGPVAEEVFFRGLVYGFLRRWGMGVAIFGSALAFVLAHPAAGVTQGVGGALFAIAYEAGGRLTAPIAIHVLGNGALLALSLAGAALSCPS